MNSMLKKSWFVFITTLFAISAAYAADPAQGMDYDVLSPAQRASVDGKLEVIEFFSYGCPHCANFNPSVTRWAKELPDNVKFVRIPVSFGRREWGQLVRAYYALESTGQLEQLDDALFDAIHKKRTALFSEEALSAWVGAQGGDAVKFREAFNSDAVSKLATQGDQMSRDYRVNGVPQLVIGGKYIAHGRSFDEMLEIASALVKKAQGERPASQR